MLDIRKMVLQILGIVFVSFLFLLLIMKILDLSAEAGNQAITDFGEVTVLENQDTFLVVEDDAADTKNKQLTWSNLQTNIVKTGTIGSGTWQGTAIADAYVPNTITIDRSTESDSALISYRAIRSDESDSALASYTSVNATNATSADEADSVPYSGITGVNAGTNLSADLEEEVTEGSLADSVIVSADIKAGTIVDSDMANDGLDPDKLVGDAVDDDKIGSSIILQNAGTDISADLEEEVTEGSLANSTIITADIKDETILEADLDITAAPTDEYVLTYESDTGKLVWQPDSTGSGSLGSSLTSTTDDITSTGDIRLLPAAGKHVKVTNNDPNIEFTDTDSGDTWNAGVANGYFRIQNITDSASIVVIDGSGNINLDAATSLEIPNGANPTTDVAGKIAVDSSAAPGSGIRFYGDAAYTVPGTFSKSFVILNPVATDDYPMWCTPYAITIKSVRVQCLGGTNIVGQLTECDAEGINAAVVDSSDITATANNSVDDDGTLSNPSIDALDYVGWKTESISGTPTSVTVTFDYIINQVN